jgi:hypothetical protein
MSGLEKVKAKMKNLRGPHEVPFSELLPDEFVRKYTRFQTRQAMLDAAGVKSAEDINSDSFSQFVTGNSRFATWRDMEQLAIVEWGKREAKKMGL